jgi:hypothetical protein
MYRSWLNVKIKMYNFKSQRLLFNTKFAISRYIMARTREGGGCTQRPPPPKIGKNMIFLVYNRDFKHEIPQTISCLPPLDAIFLSAPPPPL